MTSPTGRYHHYRKTTEYFEKREKRLSYRTSARTDDVDRRSFLGVVVVVVVGGRSAGAEVRKRRRASAPNGTPPPENVTCFIDLRWAAMFARSPPPVRRTRHVVVAVLVVVVDEWSSWQERFSSPLTVHRHRRGRRSDASVKRRESDQICPIRFFASVARAFGRKREVRRVKYLQSSRGHRVE